MAASRSLRLRWSFASLVLAVSSGFTVAAGCSGGDGAGTNPSDGPDAATTDATTPGDSSVGTDAPSADAVAATDVGAPQDTGTDAPKDAGADADAQLNDASAGDAADASDAGDASDAADASDAGNGWYDVYDPALVPKFELTLDAAALAILSNTSTLDADRKKWAHGTFKCGDTVIADVGVRRKGSSTFRALPGKAAFKIRFDKYVPGQRFLGLTELTLNNSMSDPTFIAERLAYQVFRTAGLPAQKANSAEVTINGAPWGVYLNVETPNQDFITRVFGAKAKTLYEVNFGSEWLPGVENGFDENVGDGTKSDVTALFASVQAASNATLLADVAAHLDTAEWAKFSAAEATVGHYDGYGFGIFGSHNYFMAGDPNGVLSLVPWSTDLTFSNRMTVVNANVPTDPMGSGPTLLQRCKLSAGCWATYKDQVKAVLAAYEGLGLVNLAQTWHAQIDAMVVADPKKETTVLDYNAQTATLYQWIAARPAVVRGQLGLVP